MIQVKSRESFGDKDMEDIMVVVCPITKNGTCLLLRNLYVRELSPQIRQREHSLILKPLRKGRRAAFLDRVSNVPVSIQIQLLKCAFSLRSNDMAYFRELLFACEKGRQFQTMVDLLSLSDRKTWTIQIYLLAGRTFNRLERFEDSLDYLDLQFFKKEVRGPGQIRQFISLRVSAYRGLDKWAEAIDQANYLPLKEWNSYIFGDVLDTYLKLEKPEEATELITAYPREKWDIFIYSHVADYYISIGDFAKAIETLKWLPEEKWNNYHHALMEKALSAQGS